MVAGISPSLGWKTWLTRSSAVGYLPDYCFEPSSPALSVLVSGWITTNALFLSQASHAIVQSRRVQNRQITRRRQISTGMSASVYRCSDVAVAGSARVTGKPEVIVANSDSRDYFRLTDNPGAISFCLNL